MRSLKLSILMSAAALVGITAGCGWDSATDPRPHFSDWDQVRYREGAHGEESSLELTVLSDGRLSMTDTRGDAVSLRGLLAGGNLETLARLLDSLPPDSYFADSPCPEDDGFVVTVTRGINEISYSSHSCDPDAPGVVTALRLLFEELNSHVVARGARLVANQVLAEGFDSDITLEGTVVVDNRDALVEVLRRHRRNGAVAVPRVDFERQFVVAEFLGERSGSIHAVRVERTELTEGGWLRIVFSRFEPIEGCSADGVVRRPYVFLAVDRASSDLLLETSTVQVSCETGG